MNGHLQDKEKKWNTYYLTCYVYDVNKFENLCLKTDSHSLNEKKMCYISAPPECQVQFQLAFFNLKPVI